MLKPAPQDLRGMACTVCDHPVSKWEVVPRTPEGATVFLCSPCVLYASPFGKQPGWLARLEAFAAELEAAVERPLARDAQGRLEGVDADRVVFSIVVVSNFHKPGAG
jgi:hypothetical protein